MLAHLPAIKPLLMNIPFKAATTSSSSWSVCCCCCWYMFDNHLRTKHNDPPEKRRHHDELQETRWTRSGRPYHRWCRPHSSVCESHHHPQHLYSLHRRQRTCEGNELRIPCGTTRESRRRCHQHLHGKQLLDRPLLLGQRCWWIDRRHSRFYPHHNLQRLLHESRQGTEATLNPGRSNWKCGVLCKWVTCLGL